MRCLILDDLADGQYLIELLHDTSPGTVITVCYSAEQTVLLLSEYDIIFAAIEQGGLSVLRAAKNYRIYKVAVSNDPVFVNLIDKGLADEFLISPLSSEAVRRVLCSRLQPTPM